MNPRLIKLLSVLGVLAVIGLFMLVRGGNELEVHISEQGSGSLLFAFTEDVRLKEFRLEKLENGKPLPVAVEGEPSPGLVWHLVPRPIRGDDDPRGDVEASMPTSAVMFGRGVRRMQSAEGMPGRSRPALPMEPGSEYLLTVDTVDHGRIERRFVYEGS